jgi:hypothetical protein
MNRTCEKHLHHCIWCHSPSLTAAQQQWQQLPPYGTERCQPLDCMAYNAGPRAAYMHAVGSISVELSYMIHSSSADIHRSQPHTRGKCTRCC